MNNSHSNIQKSSIIAFSLIAVVIIICSLLIGYNLKQQSEMLRASGISYEQRILLERVNEQIHLLLEENSNAELSDRILTKLRKDITQNGKLLSANQSRLHQLLLDQDTIFYKVDKPFNIDELNNNLKQIDSLWLQFNARIDKISSASLNTLRAGYDYWQPVDTLLAQDGLLFNRMAELNNLVYQASLEQNTKIRILYTLIFCSALTGLWLIWYLTLRPLSKRLAENYEEILTKNADLKFQANHDPMTHLQNRAAFNRKMAAISENVLGIGNSSLILLDVDEFKSINDNHGHQVGDEILIKLANIMQEGQLETEAAYRLGGDEFAIVIDEINNRDQLLERLERLIHNIRTPSVINGKKVATSCSFGVAWGEKCGETLKEVFNAADAALYKVKENGRNDYLLFGDISDQNVTDLIKIEQQLRTAVEHKQFIVHYQPIVNLETGELDSFEALARWKHPTRGELLPEEWLSIAERLSLSSEITSQIIALVERDYCHWRDKNLAIRTVHINVTERMLIDGSAYSQLKSILDRTPENKNWLGIEVTESIVFDRSFNKIQEQLKLIHDAGIKISLDDFGTGFANLSHLSSIPFDSMKINQSFTGKMLEDPCMFVIIKSLIELSAGLDKKIICEGIELPETQRALMGLGCKFSQGFLHDRSLPFDQSCSLLSKSGEAA